MNCNEDDILDVDIDPDFLINLVGKLSLNNISDFSEVLQTIDSNPEALERELNSGACSSPVMRDIPAPSQIQEVSCPNNSFELNNNQSKDGFLSSIGLLSTPGKTVPRNMPSPHKKPWEEDSYMLQKEHRVYDSKESYFCDLPLLPHMPKESHRMREKLAKSSSKAQTNRKMHSDYDDRCDGACDNACYDRACNNAHCDGACSTTRNGACDHVRCDKACNDACCDGASDNARCDGACDNAHSRLYDLPLLPGANFPHKSVSSLNEVFSGRGMVYDIQLSDIIGSLNLPFDFDDENGEKNEDLVEKSVCSPDSGISTSPCPGVSSPYSPTSDLEQNDDSSNDCFELFLEDYDVSQVLEDLIEIERSLRCDEILQNANVPVFRDAIDPEDHKEKIVSFLKEPILNDLKSPTPEDDKPGFPELYLENNDLSDFAASHKNAKKPSPRPKKHKLGIRLKCTVKKELHHSSIFSKAKTISSKNRILKQIQGDERIQKQVKLIQKLIVSKKLKRTDVDDRVNKKRRIQLTDSYESHEELRCN